VRIAIVVAVVGCTYGAPDYSDSLFKCDDAHACPTNQICLGGVCQRASDNGDGVVCADAGVCARGMQCCVDNANPPRCIAASDPCSGQTALCDGPKDCDSSSACCDSSPVRCGDPQGDACGAWICRTGSDCAGSDSPNCCPDGDLPWKRCEFFPCTMHVRSYAATRR